MAGGAGPVQQPRRGAPPPRIVPHPHGAGQDAGVPGPGTAPSCSNHRDHPWRHRTPAPGPRRLRHTPALTASQPARG
ncbi:hypothetical protein CFR78_13680 [Komagataeibacter rhaeticus]|uniref:hypothetical protein n=1 Tax=Komagataeibacter rhaeticus TaxID=215221 RepID=UPI0005549E11|nr:hypothetical protein [Komagataeibacter rhaeticus]MBL7238739.1 hypothetical protein [Komagataeibacter rhaeticus]PYD52613.1 hypothetical protein CFR78_13680 [Komagataeibacter rhaeticus]